MSEIVLFGGTTEGRELAVRCAERKIQTVVCVVSGYGKMLLPESGFLQVLEKALDLAEMEELLRREGPKLVLDATHPYAEAATANISAACRRTGTAYVRVLRDCGSGERPSETNAVKCGELSVGGGKAAGGEAKAQKKLADWGEAAAEESQRKRGTAVRGGLTDEELQAESKLLSGGEPADGASRLKRETTEAEEAAGGKSQRKRRTAVQDELTEREPQAKRKIADWGELTDGEQPRREERVTRVASVKAAVDYLSGTAGPIFVTTGSKELKEFQRLEGYRERVYARVLPDSRVLRQCEEMGFSGKQIVAMQGPFSVEMNLAMMRSVGAAFLVTKESGAAGGFPEKLAAAKRLGIEAVIIGRPKETAGVSLPEAMGLLEAYGEAPEKLDAAAGENAAGAEEMHVPETSGTGKDPRERRLYLVGIGMGGPGQWTLEAERALREADLVAGAVRMIESVSGYLTGKRVLRAYQSGEILDWLEQEENWASAVVVYSGDIGFYSGAKQLLAELAARETGASRTAETGRPEKLTGTRTYFIRDLRLKTELLPGISTAAYLCARLQIPWEDVFLASAHGKMLDVGELLAAHRNVFLLLGGKDGVGNLCRTLVERGYGGCLVTVGERLSYPEERLLRGTAETLKDLEFDGLCAVLLQNNVENASA